MLKVSDSGIGLVKTVHMTARNLSFSPGGAFLAASCQGGGILFDPDSGAQRMVVPMLGGVMHVKITNNGLFVCAAENRIHVTPLPSKE